MRFLRLAYNFMQPASVAVTPRGTILVLHRGAHPVIEFESRQVRAVVG